MSAELDAKNRLSDEDICEKLSKADYTLLRKLIVYSKSEKVVPFQQFYYNATEKGADLLTSIERVTQKVIQVVEEAFNPSEKIIETKPMEPLPEKEPKMEHVLIEESESEIA